jgi:hypothetical protein
MIKKYMKEDFNAFNPFFDPMNYKENIGVVGYVIAAIFWIVVIGFVVKVILWIF